MWFKTYLIKSARREAARVAIKAIREAFNGGINLTPGPGIFEPERRRAARIGRSIVKSFADGGMPIFRGRIKTPESILASGQKALPNDLLAMQVYARGPRDVQRAMKHMQDIGVQGLRAKAKVLPHYQAVHLKGTLRSVPFELQLVSDPVSNAGQLIAHSLHYKPHLEAPNADVHDLFVGRSVGARLARRSWIGKRLPELARLGVKVKTV